MHRAADVTLIETSREPVGIDAEVVRRVTSLRIEDDSELDEAGLAPAVRLFVEGAQAADGGFQLTAANAEDRADPSTPGDTVDSAGQRASTRGQALLEGDDATLEICRMGVQLPGVSGHHESVAQVLGQIAQGHRPEHHHLGRRLLCVDDRAVDASREVSVVELGR